MVLLFIAFGSALSFHFLMIGGARGLHFGSLFNSALRALGFWESNSKWCRGCKFQRVVFLPDRVFLQVLIVGAFWWWASRIGMIRACLWSFYFGVLRCARCHQRSFENKYNKKSQKRNARWILSRIRKQDFWVSENQKGGQVDQTRPDVLEGTAVDENNSSPNKGGTTEWGSYLLYKNYPCPPGLLVVSLSLGI